VLEYVPSSFKVIQHLRPKLSCRSCETIVQAPMPALPIERGRPGPGLITMSSCRNSATTSLCTAMAESSG
jgi:transposase